MTTQDWINTALQGTPVWNIGQLDKETTKALNKLVSQGTLNKSKEIWASICIKTVYTLA